MTTIKGKAYANKKKKEDRPIGDFYSTPKSLVWVAEDIIKEEFPKKESIFEPAAGILAIHEEIIKLGYMGIWDDAYFPCGVYDVNSDYLENNCYFDYVITNPPFSLWDEFVLKAKTHCKKFMFIGRFNYLGTNGRYEKELFKNLKYFMPFNRYVDYQTPYREDGLFHVGAMGSAWFLWDMKYTGLPMIKQLDVQKYAKLGAFNK